VQARLQQMKLQQIVEQETVEKKIDDDNSLEQVSLGAAVFIYFISFLFSRLLSKWLRLLKSSCVKWRRF
jgi:hypothetical protein